MVEQKQPSTNCWKFQKTMSEEYFYLPDKVTTAWKIIGPGNRQPNPLELKKALEKHNRKGWEYCGSQYPGILFNDLGTSEITSKQRKENKNLVCLEHGIYYHGCTTASKPERLIKFNLREDKCVGMEGFAEKILIDLNRFLSNEAIYKKIEMQYKRGILLYGQPGCGKTALIRYIVNYKLPKNSLVIFLGGDRPDRLPSKSFIKTLSKDKRLKIFIIEELMPMAKENFLPILLNFLDGEQSVNKSITIATTNYANELPMNIVERPSRFDLVFKIGCPDKKTRLEILKLYLMRQPSKEELAVTTNKSSALIKEAALLSILQGVNVKEAIKLIENRIEMAKKDFSDKAGEIGFGKKRYFNSMNDILDDID